LATFYLLPPRPVVGDHLLDGVERLMPGLDLSVAARRRLTESLLDALELRADIFLVFREDLPAGVPAEEALRDGYGADIGDDIVELRLAAGERVVSRSWRLGAMAAA